jgi:N-acetylglucosamine kinase-like BadF-type ATPase
MQSDFSIALDDAFGDGPGVLILSGTSSVRLGEGRREQRRGVAAGVRTLATREAAHGSGGGR